MKKTSTLVTLLFLFQISFSQQSRFSKIYFDNINYYSAEGMVKSYDGGLVVTGIYNYSPCVMKIDSLGSIIWAKQFGSTQNESVNAVVRTTDSCYVMAGKMFDVVSTTHDIQITKIDQSGNIIWSKTVILPENQEAMAISQTSDGGFILTGYESYNMPPNTRMLVAKMDSVGEVDWLQVYQLGNYSNYGNAIKQTPDSGYAVVGYSEYFPPFDPGGILFKLSSVGNVVWANKYNLNAPVFFIGNDLVVAQDGIFSYYTTDNVQAIVKTDFNGNDFWRETINGAVPGLNLLNEVSSKLKLLPDGNLIYATGNRGFASASSIVCIDSTGSFKWSQYIYNSVHDIEQTDDHGFFLLGNGPLIGVRTTTISNQHVGIIKSDSLGNADLCTTNNPVVSINFGTTTKASITLTAYPYSAFSTPLFPVNSTMVLSEITSCVDVIGGIDDHHVKNFNFYPNPGHSDLNLLNSGLSGNINILITDMIGKSVLSCDVIFANEDYKISHTLSPGIYIVTLTSQEKKVSGKFVVE